MQQKQNTTASTQYPGFYVPPLAEASLVYAVENGDFEFSAMLDLPNSDEVMIMGKFRGNHVDSDEITGYVVGARLETVSPLWALLSEHDQRKCTLSAISVSNDLGLTEALYDTARAIRVAEIETKIVTAIRNA